MNKNLDTRWMYALAAVVLVLAAVLMLSRGCRRENYLDWRQDTYAQGPLMYPKRCYHYEYHDGTGCRKARACHMQGGAMIAVYNNEGKRDYQCFKSKKWEGKTGRGALACRKLSTPNFVWLYDTKKGQCKDTSSTNLWKPAVSSTDGPRPITA